MSLLCLIGIHRAKKDAKRIEKLLDGKLVVMYYDCKGCNKEQITKIGYSGIHTEKWKGKK